ncbi:MAG: dihydroneopterin aldolase, partial [Pseudomonadota bacterium]
YSIFVKELSLEMFIGVLEQEKQNKQNVLVSAELEISTNRTSWKNDQIENTVSYGDIVNLIKKLASEDHINLVETFADKIITNCFDHSQAIQSVSVEIHKTEIIENTSSVGCKIKKIRN